MIKANVTEVNAQELTQHLQETERCKVIIRPHESGFSLRFEPRKTEASSISNMELIAEWAAAHRHTISVFYNEVESAIVVDVKRLFPKDTYNENEILK